MSLDRRFLIIGVTIIIALGIYFFWYMSPYEQCVRAKTEINSEQSAEDNFTYQRNQSPEVVENEAKRDAKIACAENSN